ncbi:hypothetical protein V3M68_05300 [Trueperella pyogenes]|nr:hypothetical protein [Trueperella pyogenes]UVJ56090.1 hypothetical protein M1F27_01860 [Trueperella pyogenes]WHU58828.1 hypothetical protein QEV21_09085 [Trueperella pyogenes]
MGEPDSECADRCGLVHYHKEFSLCRQVRVDLAELGFIVGKFAALDFLPRYVECGCPVIGLADVDTEPDIEVLWWHVVLAFEANQ